MFGPEADTKLSSSPTLQTGVMELRGRVKVSLSVQLVCGMLARVRCIDTNDDLRCCGLLGLELFCLKRKQTTCLRCMLDRYCELVFTTLPQTVVSLLLYGSGALGWCLNYDLDNCVSELKYYKYLEQDKNYSKFYCNLESKYYQFVK